MNSKEARTLVDLVREAKWGELVLLTLLALPLVLNAWRDLLGSLPFLSSHDGWKVAIMIAIAALFIGGLALAKITKARDEKFARATLHVRTALLKREARPWASFDVIREKVDERYSHAFLKRLIDRNPGVFKRTEVKVGAGTKPGIGLVPSEPKDDPTDS